MNDARRVLRDASPDADPKLEPLATGAGYCCGVSYDALRQAGWKGGQTGFGRLVKSGPEARRHVVKDYPMAFELWTDAEIERWVTAGHAPKHIEDAIMLERCANQKRVAYGARHKPRGERVALLGQVGAIRRSILAVYRRGGPTRRPTGGCAASRRSQRATSRRAAAKSPPGQSDDPPPGDAAARHSGEVEDRGALTWFDAPASAFQAAHRAVLGPATPAECSAIADIAARRGVLLEAREEAA